MEVESLAKMSRRNYKSSLSQAGNCLKKIMDRTATCFVLIVTLAVLAAANIVAQQTPSTEGQNLQPNAGGEEAAVKRIVDGIMQPYLAQGQRNAGGRRWSRSPYLGAIVAISLHGHRYFFPYGKATDAGAPFTRETLVEIGSCTKTFTTTLFALAINRNNHRSIWAALDVKWLGVNVADNGTIEVQVPSQTSSISKCKATINVNTISRRIVVFLRDVNVRAYRQNRTTTENKKRNKPNGPFHNARGVYCAGVVLFNLRRRNSIAQSAAMVSMSLMM